MFATAERELVRVLQLSGCIQKQHGIAGLRPCHDAIHSSTFSGSGLTILRPLQPAVVEPYTGE